MSLPLPFEALNGHYMEMLCRYDAGIAEKAERFHQYIDWCAWNGYSKPSAYRIDHAMQQFIRWAKKTDPMARTLPNTISQGNIDKRKGMNGKMLLSLDMSSANYSTMRWMAKMHDIPVPDTWADLCRELEIHPFLVESKVFRQYCFGNYMPSRYATLQKHVMALLCRRMGLTVDELVFSSHDEVVLEYPQEGYKNFMPKVQKALEDEGIGDVINIKGTIYSTIGIDDQILAKVVQGAALHKVMDASADRRTDSVLKIEYGLSDDGDFYEKKKVLVGVSSNKFYAYLRTIVLNETLQTNDLIFQHEGMAAMWLLKGANGWESGLEPQ